MNLRKIILAGFLVSLKISVTIAADGGSIEEKSKHIPLSSVVPSTSDITCLPTEILQDIATKVCASNFKNTVRFAGTCSQFRGVIKTVGSCETPLSFQEAEKILKDSNWDSARLHIQLNLFDLPKLLKNHNCPKRVVTLRVNYCTLPRDPIPYKSLEAMCKNFPLIKEKIRGTIETKDMNADKIKLYNSYSKAYFGVTSLMQDVSENTCTQIHGFCENNLDRISYFFLPPSKIDRFKDILLQMKNLKNLCISSENKESLALESLRWIGDLNLEVLNFFNVTCEGKRPFPFASSLRKLFIVEGTFPLPKKMPHKLECFTFACANASFCTQKRVKKWNKQIDRRKKEKAENF